MRLHERHCGVFTTRPPRTVAHALRLLWSCARARSNCLDRAPAATSLTRTAFFHLDTETREHTRAITCENECIYNEIPFTSGRRVWLTRCCSINPSWRDFGLPAGWCAVCSCRSVAGRVVIDAFARWMSGQSVFGRTSTGRNRSHRELTPTARFTCSSSDTRSRLPGTRDAR